MATYTINEEREEFVVGDLEARANGQGWEVHLREFIPIVGIKYYVEQFEATGEKEVVGFRECSRELTREITYFILQTVYHASMVAFLIAGLQGYFKGNLP